MSKGGRSIFLKLPKNNGNGEKITQEKRKKKLHKKLIFIYSELKQRTAKMNEKDDIHPGTKGVYMSMKLTSRQKNNKGK